MTTASLMRVCVIFGCASGIVQIAHPQLFMLRLSSAPSLDSFAMTSAVGFGSLFLGLACWPIGEAVDPLAIFTQLAYNLFAGAYLGYLACAGSSWNAVVYPACISHSAIAVLLSGVAYEKAIAAKA
jgi:hypothetical protein